MHRVHPPAYPELEEQIKVRGILKVDIARKLGIPRESLTRKLSGRVSFRMSEMRAIAAMFPDIPAGVLFGIGER